MRLREKVLKSDKAAKAVKKEAAAAKKKETNEEKARNDKIKMDFILECKQLGEAYPCESRYRGTEFWGRDRYRLNKTKNLNRKEKNCVSPRTMPLAPPGPPTEPSPGDIERVA